jgi:uncharacterized protein (DUF433 family)
MIRIARWHEWIAARPEAMGGRRCIEGTRIGEAIREDCLGDER